MASSDKYIIIPGTQQKVYDGTVVMLHRLPNLRWIIHNGYYSYNGRKQKGWYFSSIPSDTTMPVFNEDLIAMTIIDQEPHPCPPPHPPCPPPGPGPHPPAPVPVPFTPQDKQHLEEAMLTVEDLAERDKLGSKWLPNGKVVRVNNSDGQGKIEYYSWNAETSSWEEASLGYRYMTREEIEEAIADDIISIIWSNDEGSLVLGRHRGEDQKIILEGVAHDPQFVEGETYEIHIPRYGLEDLIINIPKGWDIVAIGGYKDYIFEDGHKGPAIAVRVTNGNEVKEIAGDASGLVDIYTGVESATTTVTITSENGQVRADVKLSSVENNRIKVDRSGLYVDVSDLEERLDNLENRSLIPEGAVGQIVVTTEDGIVRSSATIGGDELDTTSTTNLAKESAVVDAISWKTI